MDSCLRRLTHAFCLGIICTSLALGQITIQSEDFPGEPGVTLTYYTNITQSMLVNVGSSGANCYWDFTEGPEDLEMEEQFIRPDESPFHEYFPQANRVRISDLSQFGLMGTAHVFEQLSDEELRLNGFGTEISQYPIPVPLGDGLLEYPLPLSYQDEWDNAITIDTVFTIANPDSTIPLDSLDVRVEVILGDQAEVDAWGTLEGPLGTNQVLRARHDTGIEATVYVWLILFWVPIWDTTYAQIRYEWLAEDYGSVVTIGSYPGETNPNFDHASRFTRLTNNSTSTPSTPNTPLPRIVSLSPNYPNPFNESTSLTFTLPLEVNGKASLAVYNILGRRIVTLWEGASDGGVHHVVWNGRNTSNTPVSTGIYFITLNTGSGVFSRPIVKLN